MEKLAFYTPTLSPRLHKVLLPHNPYLVMDKMGYAAQYTERGGRGRNLYLF